MVEAADELRSENPFLHPYLVSKFHYFIDGERRKIDAPNTSHFGTFCVFVLWRARLAFDEG